MPAYLKYSHESKLLISGQPRTHLMKPIVYYLATNYDANVWSILNCLYYADLLYLERYYNFIADNQYIKMGGQNVVPLQTMNVALECHREGQVVNNDGTYNVHLTDADVRMNLPKSVIQCLDLAIEHCANKTFHRLTNDMENVLMEGNRQIVNIFDFSQVIPTRSRLMMNFLWSNFNSTHEVPKKWVQEDLIRLSEFEYEDLTNLKSHLLNAKLYFLKKGKE